MANRTKPTVEKLIRGYLGFCEGRGKAALTISSYEGDLLHFRDWLKSRDLDFYALRPKDLDLYGADLRKNGQRINTQRRKLLSARALFRYAFVRKKIPEAFQVKAPDRREKLPWIPGTADLERVLAQIGEGPLGLRNRLILLLLAESGMNLQELCALEWRDWEADRIEVQGKRKRSVKVLGQVQDLLARWRSVHGGKHLFPGFNRFGPTSIRMTSRGVELLFRQLSKAAKLPRFHPKSLRHHAVIRWLQEGATDQEIRQRLGVNPLWSLEPYRRALEVK